MPRDGVRRTSLARHGPMDIGRLHGSVIGGRERPLYLSCPLGLAKRCVRAFEANSGATVAGWRQTIRLRASPPCRRLSRLVDLADAAQSGSEIRTALERPRHKKPKPGDLSVLGLRPHNDLTPPGRCQPDARFVATGAFASAKRSCHASPKRDGDLFPTGVTVEVDRPIAGRGSSTPRCSSPRACLSARQTNVPPRRSASPIAEGLTRSPKRPPQTRLREAFRPLPHVLSRWPGLSNPATRASEPGIAARSPSADSFLAHTRRICGHGRPRNTPHLSRTPARRRGSHTHGCYAAASRARGRRERAHPSCRMDRPGTRHQPETS